MRRTWFAAGMLTTLVAGLLATFALQGGSWSWSWLGSLIGRFVNGWNRLNLGNLSEAMAALATFLAVLTTLAAMRHENRRHRRAELDAQLDRQRDKIDEYNRRTAQVGLVVKRASPQSVDFRVVNRSGYPLHGALLLEPSSALPDGEAARKLGMMGGIVLEVIGYIPPLDSVVGRVDLIKKDDKNTENVVLRYEDDFGNGCWIYANGDRGPGISEESSLWKKGQSICEARQCLDPWYERLGRWRHQKKMGKGNFEGSDQKEKRGKLTVWPKPPGPDPKAPAKDRPDPGAAS